jgi:glycosyltransferase involved in cell wall biosynthesis
MKVLHVIPSFAPAWRYGGPVVAALGLTRELARQGHQVSVFTTNADGPRPLDVPTERAVALDGVDVWYFPRERPMWYYFSRPLGRALRERVADFDIVHIHSIYLWPTTIAAFWCRRRRVPYLVRPAGSLDPVLLSTAYEGWMSALPSRAKKWLYLKTVGSRDLNGAAGIHFTSQAEMEASHSLGVRPNKYVRPLGVDPPPSQRDDTLSLRSRHPELQGKRIVLFLSRLDPKKGLDMLVPALGSLAAGRSDFALVVAGSGDAAYERRAASLVAQHRLQDRVVWLGLVRNDDKWDVLREADIFVLPSYHENFGFAVVEAMSAGLPVVISDRVNIHQEVHAAGAGIVTGLEIVGLAAAIERLLDDDGLRKRMGNAGARLVRERFTWESAAANVARVYEAIAGRGSDVGPDTVGPAGG